MALEPARLRFGIIGCGMVANFHAKAILRIEDAELAGISDCDPGHAADFAARHGTRAYDSVDALLADDRIDAVCICTPSGLHATQALQALAAHKHVVVEKPMAIHLADADRIIAAADVEGLLVSVISQLRFSETVQAVQRAIHEGAFGRLVSGSLAMKFYRSEAYYRTGGWRGTWSMDGGGALMNQGIHGVDLLLHLMGPLDRLTAFTRTQTRPIETEDSAAAALVFACGAVGTLEASTTCCPGYPRRLEICGDQGSVVLEEDTIIRWDLPIPAPGHPDRTTGASATPGGVASDPTAVKEDGHFRQLSNFVAAARKGEPLLVDARSGRQPLEAILSVYESARTGLPVILKSAGEPRACAGQPPATEGSET